MRDLKLMNKKDFDFNMESLAEEVKNGDVTREDAYESKNKITEAFKSGDNNRRIEQLIKENPNKYRITGDR